MLDSRRRAVSSAEVVVIDRSCGPEGCEIDWLTSRRHSLEDDDIVGFTAFAGERGWGDGLPLIPPTEARVRGFLAECGRFPDELIAVLPPTAGEATVEKIAVNAVMAGAPAAAMPLLVAVVEALADDRFNLGAVNATTGSSVPAMIVNGDIRNELDIPYSAGCLGGFDGSSAAIARAVRLITRNISGQAINKTSKSVFGNPSRLGGLLFGEWEELSPWEPLASRRGVQGNAVTVVSAMGTMNIVDPLSDPEILLQQIGKSAGYPGANGFANAITYSEAVVAINPIWAGFLAEKYPDVRDVERRIWELTGRPLDSWPTQYHRWFREGERVAEDGLVHLTPSPEQIMVVVAGGQGGLHAAVLHGWGESVAATRPIRRVVVTH
jgi:hypothetical protein